MSTEAKVTQLFGQELTLSLANHITSAFILGAAAILCLTCLFIGVYCCTCCHAPAAKPRPKRYTVPPPPKAGLSVVPMEDGEAKTERKAEDWQPPISADEKVVKVAFADETLRAPSRGRPSPVQVSPAESAPDYPPPPPPPPSAPQSPRVATIERRKKTVTAASKAALRSTLTEPSTKATPQLVRSKSKKGSGLFHQPSSSKPDKSILVYAKAAKSCEYLGGSSSSTIHPQAPSLEDRSINRYNLATRTATELPVVNANPAEEEEIIAQLIYAQIESSLQNSHLRTLV